MTRRYSKRSQHEVKKAMHKMKRGRLKSGQSGKTVRSRKQAIAIGLSEARKKEQKCLKKITTPLLEIAPLSVYSPKRG